MDWIRRNWPDLIIGFALLAVIAGIIATLLSGGSFFPFGNSGPSSGTQSTITTPQVGTSPTATPSTNAPSLNTPDTQPTVTSEAPPPGPPILAEGPETVETAAPEATSDSVTVVSPEVSSETAESSSESVTPLAPEAPIADSAAAASATDAPAQTSISGEASTLFPESPYRISVGSYRDEANAQRRAESFISAGYPVFIGRQDDLAIVLVGPYDSRADAETAVATIQRDGLEAAPLLFELSDDPNAAANIVEAGTNAASNAASSAETAANTTVNTAQTATPASGLQGSYIQAGAYDSSEGARPQRERLESFGFAVAEVREGSFIKLLVGPFDESGLSSAQARLNEQGVEHFVRTF